MLEVQDVIITLGEKFADVQTVRIYALDEIQSILKKHLHIKRDVIIPLIKIIGSSTKKTDVPLTRRISVLAALVY